MHHLFVCLQIGNHTELILKDGLYAKLNRAQRDGFGLIQD